MKNNVAFKAHISTVFVFALIGILSIFFVPTHDDLISLSCARFGEAFRASLFYGNGRFLGNTLVSVFLNNTFWDFLIRSVCIGGTIVLSAILVKGYTSSAIIISSLIYVGIGFPIFRQVFVWGHGFYNYVPPVFLLLITLCLLKWLDLGRCSRLRIITVIIIFLTSLAAQLFAENSTTINTLISALVLMWSILKKRPKVGAAVAVLGSCIGAFAMFVGPYLFGVADKLDEYRSVESSVSSLIITAGKNAFEIVSTLAAGWGLWLVLSVSILLLAKGKQMQTRWIRETVLVGFLPFSVFQNFATRGIVRLAVDLVFAVYLFTVLVLLLKLLGKSTRHKISVVLGLAVLSAVQLLIVNPIGARCLFVSYALLAVGVLYLLCNTTETAYHKHSPLVYKSFLGVVCTVYAVMLVLYAQSWSAHTSRMAYAQEQLKEGKTQIEIIELPYEVLFHCPNDSYVYPYTFNHGNKEEMSFIYISYKDYCEKMK